ncbi:TonB-dependent receptor plug domain-containing protein [Hyphococcus luteus]|uniref:TonB-dependent receptor n=1 Tax=Hyphococcus luteus TaxID=2058213 RepID=A0A2S7K808_9PROT|nr:TonB-dependent receptor [Marinicaulis flavus]PQA88599.1 TonB-dependent receptor [Marinicaulis flavus]
MTAFSPRALRNTITPAIASALACATSPALAEDEIIVSVLRAPTPLSETGSSVSVITAEEIIDRQYVFAADALRDAAGVAIAQNGGAGGASSARIRGASSGQTLIVIDGVVANDPSAPQGGFNFANLDASTVERIEVLRGPQSLLYGADAIGGVISVTTKHEGTEGFLEGGSFGTARAGLAAGFENEDFYGRLSLSGVTTDGVSRADAGTEKDGYRAGTATLSAGAELAEHWRGEIALRTTHSRAKIDGFPPPAYTLGDTEEIERTEDYLASGRLLQSFTNFDGALTLAYNAIDRRNTDNGVETYSAKGGRLTVDYLADIALSDNLRLLAGAEAERTSAEVSGVDESAKAGAVFAAVEVKPVEAVTLSVGGRRDEFSNFKGATTARASAVWRVDETWRLRASWGEGFRAPSLFELNYDQFGATPNPNLRPEKANGFDIGVEKLFGDDGRQRLAVTFFRTRVEDQIDFDLIQYGYYNIDKTRARGVEVEGNFALSPRLSADLTYSFTDAVDLSTDAQLLRQPKHKGTAVVTYKPADKLSLSASVIVNGRENDSPAPNDGFVRLDLRGAYQLTDALELYGRVENATDAAYQDVSGYGEPGLAAYGGVRVRL